MQRRTFARAALSLCALRSLALAQGIEKPWLTIAVGGKGMLYFLPLTIAEALGYFNDEGLNVNIVDFAGGSRALQAVVGGSADVMSGAFEHTLDMQPKGQRLRAFALQGRTPQMVLGVNPRTMSARAGVADLRGRRVGVSAPGSGTHVMVNFALARAGLAPSEVSIVGVGLGHSALAAMRSGHIDAICTLDPTVTLLQRSDDLRILVDTRFVAEADRIFGGPMPAGCLYAPQRFIDRNPLTTQALTNALVRANKWIQASTPNGIVDVVPSSYLMGDRAAYVDALVLARKAFSVDGCIPQEGVATALRTLQRVDASLKQVTFDLEAAYTNDFVKRANAKQAKAKA